MCWFAFVTMTQREMKYEPGFKRTAANERQETELDTEREVSEFTQTDFRDNVWRSGFKICTHPISEVPPV